MAKKRSHTSHLSFIQSFLYVVVSLVLTFILVQLPVFHTFVAELGEYGYIGALLAGMLFVSVFTAAPAAVLLITLGETHAILPIAIVAGIGAVFGDYVIMSYMSSEVSEKTKLLPQKTGIMKTISFLRHSKYRFFLSILGAIVIASPLPDEIGLSLMGLSNMKRSSFLWLSFILNTVGIFLLLSLIH